MRNNIFDETSTVVVCWKITRKDNTMLFFTNHSVDISIGNDIYISSNSLSPSEILNSNIPEQNSFDVDGIIDNEKITTEDLLSGLYDRAKIDLLLVDYNNTENNVLLRSGYINDIKISGNVFVAEIYNVLSAFNNALCNVYSMSCRANLGDKLCKIDLAQYTYSGKIEKVISKRIFFDSQISANNGHYKFGLVTFSSGANKGLSFQIADHIRKEVVFTIEPYFPISVGDTYLMIAGCNKSIDACFNKFNNVVNFRGEPYVPIN